MRRVLNKMVALLLVLMLSISHLHTVSAYAADTSYKSWLQMDDRWGSLPLGQSSLTVKQSGCLVTAIAMLVCHSGSASPSSFTPATLVNYLNKNGGFTSGGSLYWAKVTGVVDDFSLVNWKVSLNGLSQTEKTETMAKYLKDGYAIIVSVKNGSHWVAVDYIDGNKVYMMDPGSTSTDLYAKYDESGIDRIALYKGKGAAGSVSGGQNASDQDPIAEGKVNCSSLYVRKGAGTEYGIVTSITKGTKVSVLGNKKNSKGETWYQVRVNGKTGYCLSKYITVDSIDTDSDDVTKLELTGYVNCSSLNVRKAPGTSSGALMAISRNQKLTITGSTKDSSGNEWYIVKYTLNGTNYTGYVSAAYVTVDQNTSSGDNDNKQPETDNQPSDTTEVKATVNCSTLNMRKDAGTGSSIVTQLSKGTTVTITGEKKASDGALWYKISVNGKTGYVHSSYLTKQSSGSNSSGSQTDTAVNTKMSVIYSSVYVRSDATTSSQAITVVYKGNQVTVTGQKKDSSGMVWYQVTTESGKKGYIRSDLLTKVQSDADSDQQEQTTSTGTVYGGWLNVRKGAGTSNSVLVTIPVGTKVTIVGSKDDSQGTKWYEIDVTYNSKKYHGFVSSAYIKK